MNTKKDPIDEALEMLMTYEEGMPERKIKDEYVCECENCNE